MPSSDCSVEPPPTQTTEGADEAAAAAPRTDAERAGVPADPAQDPNAEIPVEVSGDEIAVGSTLGGDGSVSAAKPVYTTGDTVYASMPLEGVPADATLSVYWTYQDGNAHKEEMKDVPAGAQHVNFAFSAADGMKPGNYNVQIDVNFEPVGIVDFRVQ